MKRRVFISLLTLGFMLYLVGVEVNDTLPQLPAGGGVEMHFIKSVVREKVSDTFGVGGNARKDIIDMGQKLIESVVNASSAAEYGNETLARGNKTTVDDVIFGTGVYRTPFGITLENLSPEKKSELKSVASKTKPLDHALMYSLVSELTSYSDWERIFSEHTYIIDEANSNSSSVERMNEILGNETILVAIVNKGELEWEKKIGVRARGIVISPPEEPTIWVKVESDAMRNLVDCVDNKTSGKDIVENMTEYWKQGSIEIYPVTAGLMNYLRG